MGECGNGGTTDATTPVQVVGLSGVTAIAVGANHTCVLLPGGAVDCWGYDFNGQLGNGSVSTTSTPTPVSGLVATQIAAGATHTCALLSGARWSAGAGTRTASWASGWPRGRRHPSR